MRRVQPIGRECPPSAESPFARNRCYLLRRNISCHIRRHYPSFIAHTGSCARPNSSRRLRLFRFQRVFAGRHQSLLGDGLSRHYLCNPCVGAWTPTPRSVLLVLLLASSQETKASPQTSQVWLLGVATFAVMADHAHYMRLFSILINSVAHNFAVYRQVFVFLAVNFIPVL